MFSFERVAPLRRARRSARADAARLHRPRPAARRGPRPPSARLRRPGARAARLGARRAVHRGRPADQAPRAHGAVPALDRGADPGDARSGSTPRCSSQRRAAGSGTSRTSAATCGTRRARPLASRCGRTIAVTPGSRSCAPPASRTPTSRQCPGARVDTMLGTYRTRSGGRTTASAWSSDNRRPLGEYRRNASVRLRWYSPYWGCCCSCGLLRSRATKRASWRRARSGHSSRLRDPPVPAFSWAASNRRPRLPRSG